MGLATPKERIRVTICTSLYRIEGEMYMLPGSRLTDLMNVKAKDFLPVTDVTFYHPYENKVFAKVDFAVVNRDSVLAIFPVGQQARGGEDPDEGEPR